MMRNLQSLTSITMRIIIPNLTIVIRWWKAENSCYWESCKSSCAGARRYRHSEGGGEERARLCRWQGEEWSGVSHFRSPGKVSCPRCSYLSNWIEIKHPSADVDLQWIWHFRPISIPSSTGTWNSCSFISPLNIRRPTTNWTRLNFKVHTCRFTHLQRVNERFQVVLWDKIILRGENAMLDYRRYLKVLKDF